MHDIFVLGACKEALRFRPQARHALGRVVQVDGEAVSLVVILHEAEHVVVNVAEKVHIGLDAPIVLGVLQRRVVWENAGVPAAHLVVGYLVGILHAILAQNLDRLVVEVLVDPRRRCPVLAGYLFKEDFCVGLFTHGCFEGGGEGFVVEEGPRIVELAVKGTLEIAH